MGQSKTYRVLCQKWEESERGWGTRPDGYSLHVSEDDRARFIKTYWDGMPAEVPDEYSRPDGTPYWCEVEEAVYDEVAKGKCGIWKHGTPPGSGGRDGWIPLSGGGSGKNGL